MANRSRCTFLPVLIILLFMFTCVTCQDILETKFSAENALCDVSHRIRKGCSRKIGIVRSSVECASMCALDTSCIAASVEETDSDSGATCFHHEECSYITNECPPRVQESTHRYNDSIILTKYCAHGTWNVPKQSCQCVDGFYGERCTRCHANCADLRDAGFAPNVDHRVYLDPEQDGRPFRSVCRLKKDFEAFVLLINSNRNAESKSFNKTWADYVKGFFWEGGGDGEYLWTGLHAWHRMSNANFNVLVFAFGFESRGKTSIIYRVYRDFILSDEATNFTFTFRISGSASQGSVPNGSFFGDCLGPSQNVSFSTWDTDNDQDGNKNCAANAGSGWWFSNSCHNPCNALGLGPQYLATFPRRQVMSLIGLDMNEVASESVHFVIYLKNE